jgi:hypothetical protein
MLLSEREDWRGAGGREGDGREDERRKKMMLTSGTRMSLRGVCKYNEIYFFVYACSSARLVFVRILWHI